MLIALLVFLKGEAAQSTLPRPDSLSSPPSTHSVANTGPLSISDSSMTTAHCYEPGKTKTLCFTVYNGSTDAEWLDTVRVTFPKVIGDWNAACKSQDPVDSSGSPVNLICL